MVHSPIVHIVPVAQRVQQSRSTIPTETNETRFREVSILIKPTKSSTDLEPKVECEKDYLQVFTMDLTSLTIVGWGALPAPAIAIDWATWLASDTSWISWDDWRNSQASKCQQTTRSQVNDFKRAKPVEWANDCGKRRKGDGASQQSAADWPIPRISQLSSTHSYPPMVDTPTTSFKSDTQKFTNFQRISKNWMLEHWLGIRSKTPENLQAAFPGRGRFSSGVLGGHRTRPESGSLSSASNWAISTHTPSTNPDPVPHCYLRNPLACPTGSVLLCT